MSDDRTRGDGARRRLVETTERLLARHGTRGVGLEQASAEAAVSYGSLHHAVPGGKNDLVAAVVRRSRDRVDELLAGVFGASTVLVAACRAVLAASAANLLSVVFSCDGLPDVHEPPGIR